MKNLFLVLLLSIGVTSFGQSTSNTEPIAYATPQKDTLYVLTQILPIMTEVWNQPNYIGQRPVIIPVKSVAVLKSKLTPINRNK